MSALEAEDSDKRSALMSPSMAVERIDPDRLWLRGVWTGLLEAAVEGGGLREMAGVPGFGERQAKHPLKLSWDANSPARGTASIDGTGTSPSLATEGRTGLGECQVKDWLKLSREASDGA